MEILQQAMRKGYISCSLDTTKKAIRLQGQAITCLAVEVKRWLEVSLLHKLMGVTTKGLQGKLLKQPHLRKANY